MRTFLRLLTGLLIALPGARATEPIYENTGIQDTGIAPQIDAVIFANYGTFVVSTVLPFDTQNTLYWTNRGDMFGSPGFFFDTASSTAPRRPAASFYNHRGATISASPGFTAGSYVQVAATNIESHGTLAVSSAGLLSLNGGTVDLNRSWVYVDTAVGQGIGDNVVITNGTFDPDIGIFDLAWGGLDYARLELGRFYRLDTNLGPTVITPLHTLTNYLGGLSFNQIGLFNPVWSAYTNNVSDTNWVRQAMFVGYDTNYISSRLVYSVFNSQNDFRVAAFELSMARTNVVTGDIGYETLYLSDDLAATTNYVFLVNNSDATVRPGNYRVSRIPTIDFQTGSSGNGRLTTNFYSDVTFSNTVVTNFFSAYIPYSASLIPLQPALDTASISNVPGRVEISGKNLNIAGAGIRANGLLSLQTDHLVDSQNSLLASGNYMFDLASTNGTLRLASVSVAEVQLFEGPLYLWSGVWTNQTGSTVTNTGPDPNDPSITVTNVTTNTIDIGFHAFVVDAYSLVTTQQALTHELTLRGDRVIMDDSANVVGKFFVQGRDLTLNGALALSGGEGYLGMTNFPALQNFELNGRLEVFNTATFGSEDKPIVSWVNHGNVAATGVSITSDYVQNSGAIDTSALLRLEAGIAKLEGGFCRAGGDLILQGGDIKMYLSTNSATRALFLNASHSLSDTGAGARNQLSCSDGIFMRQKPELGDLLGTRVITSASRNTVIDNVWAAEDRGVSVRGFSNNVALGRLVLGAGQNAVLQFKSPDAAGHYAIYADYLDLQGFVKSGFESGKLAEVLEVDPNFTIYYAYANVPVETLDRELGGRVRWVMDFAGPNSSVEVALPSGKTILVNRGKRESVVIDSDGDGLANGYDTTPFGEAELQASVKTSGRALIRWMAAPLTSYQVEYTDDLNGGQWTPLTTVSNPSGTIQELAVEEALNSGVGGRYYRVRYNP